MDSLHSLWVLCEALQRAFQIIRPSSIKFNELEMLQIEEELQRFSNCKTIKEVHDSDPNEYISNIVFRPQKDGNIRVILNLKPFNKQFMEHIHFKMETLKSAIDSTRPNCHFHTGKCICRFAGIYAYCWYFIDRKW